MIDDHRVLVVIPARSGSKRIPKKNIIKLGKKPLLVHSIDYAKESKYVDKIFVSTDSIEYKEIAKNAGASVPFLRPGEISGDNSTDYELFKHCLESFEENGEVFDLIVQLRPSSPMRPPGLIDKLLEILVENKNFDSIRTISQFSPKGHKLYFKEGNEVVPMRSKDPSFREPFNTPTSLLPDLYLHNGLIDVFWSKNVKDGVLSGDKIWGYETEKLFDLDTPDDLDELMKHYNETSENS